MPFYTGPEKRTFSSDAAVTTRYCETQPPSSALLSALEQDVRLVVVCSPGTGLYDTTRPASRLCTLPLRNKRNEKGSLS